MNIRKTKQPVDIFIRRAKPNESDAVAALYRRIAEAEWPFLFPHTPEQDRAFFRKALAQGVVWVATEADLMVGFCALRTGWLDHLFVMHERHGRGIGQALIAAALRRRQRVRLWTFQRNIRSRRFYALQGFSEIRLTDGRANEEKEPDVLLEWRRERE